MSRFNKSASSQTDFEMPAVGQHTARLVALIDLGTQERSFKGEMRAAEELYLAWELVEHRRKDGSPFVVARAYTNSLNVKSHLRQLVDGLRASVGKPALRDGEEFDFTKLVGPAYVVTIDHTPSGDGSKTYYNVKQVSAAHKSMSVPKPAHEPVVWSFDDDSDPPDLDWLPRSFGAKVIDLIHAAKEWPDRGEPAAAAGVGAGDAAEDEVAF